MSCRDCEQKPLQRAFIRWKNANIEIIGCRQHVKEVMEKINLDVEEMKEEHLTEFCEFCYEQQSQTTLRLNLGSARKSFKQYKINNKEKKQ